MQQHRVHSPWAVGKGHRLVRTDWHLRSIFDFGDQNAGIEAASEALRLRSEGTTRALPVPGIGQGETYMADQSKAVVAGTAAAAVDRLPVGLDTS